MHKPNFVSIRRTTSLEHGGRRRIALPIAIAVTLAALTLNSQAHQSAKPATLEEALTQIEALKKQMVDVEKFVREQVQQRGPTPAPAAPATTTPPTEPAPDTATESGFVKWDELMASKSKFKLYGFLRGEIIYDDSRPGGHGANRFSFICWLGISSLDPSVLIQCRENVTLQGLTLRWSD